MSTVRFAGVDFFSTLYYLDYVGCVLPPRCITCYFLCYQIYYYIMLQCIVYQTYKISSHNDYAPKLFFVCICCFAAARAPLISGAKNCQGDVEDRGERRAQLHCVEVGAFSLSKEGIFFSVEKRKLTGERLFPFFM